MIIYLNQNYNIYKFKFANLNIYLRITFYAVFLSCNFCEIVNTIIHKLLLFYINNYPYITILILNIMYKQWHYRYL